MALKASVQRVGQEVLLHINGEPTREFWAWGWPNSWADFRASGLRICQFDVPAPSWWTGPGRYDFRAADSMIAEFMGIAAESLLIPRVSFGYEGEEWWGQAYPEELAVGRHISGRVADYAECAAPRVACWPSAGSEVWVREAAEAMQAFVAHCEQRHGACVLGYHIGGGISTEWFRWWNFGEDLYEDYGPAARTAFHKFLRERYDKVAALQAAWGRPGVEFETAEVPEPARLHRPADGFLRDPVHERDVIDWLEFLSAANAGQALRLCRSAKQACGGHKLVGVFYGYMWGHFNTQNPARSGHLALERLLQSADIDYLAAPYHYDNRGPGGPHHSQTVAQAVERAGKLFVDEIDTSTHLAVPGEWAMYRNVAPSGQAEACELLRRDAAAILGEAGTGWWMDLYHSRWFADGGVQAAISALDALSRQGLTAPGGTGAQVALVIDPGSYAWCDLRSNLNQYFSAVARQFEWSDLGFPVDTLLLSEVGRTRPYQLYMFLNCWHVDEATRAAVRRQVRRAGVAAVWFHAAGFFGGAAGGVEGITDLTGVRVVRNDLAAVPEIEVHGGGHTLLDDSAVTPAGRLRFGARLPRTRTMRLNAENPRGWDTAAGPLFAVADPAAEALGRYVHSGQVALACRDESGWRSVYCGAPMLPGWLVRRIAAAAGVHLYTRQGCTVYRRGRLLAVHAVRAGAWEIETQPGEYVTEVCTAGVGPGRGPDGGATAPEYRRGQTRFFRVDAVAEGPGGG